MMQLQVCINELLKRGLDDWIRAAEIAHIVQSTGGAVTNKETRDLSIEIIREILERGLMKIGDLRKDGFYEWKVPAENAVERVAHEWVELKGGPNLGQICWLSNTEQGDREAKTLKDS